MRQIAVNQFRSTLKASVEAVIRDHEPLRVTRRAGEDFVVISAEDWESEQETLYVLQNQSLMKQIAESLATHRAGTGWPFCPVWPPKAIVIIACAYFHFDLVFGRDLRTLVPRSLPSGENLRMASKSSSDVTYDEINRHAIETKFPL